MTGDDAQPLSRSKDWSGLVDRTSGLQPWRRVFHAVNGTVLASLPAAFGLGRVHMVVGLGLLFMVLLAIDLYRLRSQQVNEVLFRRFRTLASPREAAAIASSTWYVLGILATYAIFPLWIAVPAILVLAWADPAASFAGRSWGQQRIGKGTITGSGAFFLVSAVILVAAYGWREGALIALAVTLVELLPLGLDDNLSVPLATGVAIWLVV